MTVGRASKPSRSAVKRMRAEYLEARSSVPPLPPDLQTALDRFIPKSLTTQQWAEVRPLVTEIMHRAEERSVTTFRRQLTHLSSYLEWTTERGLPLTIGDVMRIGVIEQYCHDANVSSALSTKTLQTRGSLLHKLAESTNPVPENQRRLSTAGYQSVKPPYTDEEAAAIVRLVINQPADAVRRQACAIVGLSLGAGAAPRDFRILRRSDIVNENGLTAHMRGDLPRIVPIRPEYQHLVARGLEGLEPDDLVLGREMTRNNITSRAFQNLVNYGPERPDAARLRTTWLVWLLGLPLSLPVVLQLAGLTTARTLTDILDFVEPNDATPDQMLITVSESRRSLAADSEPRTFTNRRDARPGNTIGEPDEVQ